MWINQVFTLGSKDDTDQEHATCFNSQKLCLSVQCPQEGTQVNTDGEVLIHDSSLTEKSL